MKGGQGRLLQARSGRQSIHQIIRTVVLLFFVSFAAVSLIGNQLLYNAYSNGFAAQQGEIYERYFSQIETNLREAERVSLQLVSSETIQQALGTIAQAQGQTLANARTALHSAITSTVGNAFYFARNVVLKDTRGFCYSYGGVVNKNELIDQVETLLDNTSDDGRVAWFGMVSGGREYMVLTRAIRESRQLSLKVLGYEAVCVDVQSMLAGIDRGAEPLLEMTEIYMDGLRLYRGGQCPELPEADVAAIEDKQLMTLKGSTIFVTKTSVFDGRIELVNYANFDRITQTLRFSRTVLLLAVLALSLLLMLATLRTIDGVLRRLDKLAAAVEHVGTDDLRVKLDLELLESRDEIGLLARHFQRLMNQVDELVNQKLKKQLYAAQAQNRMLQAQIRPHFLYNTLETIHAMAVKSGDVQIGRISMCLSKLVRASYRGSMHVPLRDEIDFVQQYLTIYRIRFGERLRARIDYNDADEEILLPQMTLQPLMENSVRYGLMTKMERGVIRLRIRRRRNQLVISLYDNGMGFPPEVVERYNHLQLEDELEIHGYGNVLQRLRYTYGEEAHVQVRSRQGHWTNLAIAIPDVLPARLREEATKPVQDSAGG